MQLWETLEPHRAPQGPSEPPRRSHRVSTETHGAPTEPPRRPMEPPQRPTETHGARRSFEENISFSFKDVSIILIMGVCVHECKCLQRSEASDSPGIGVISSCKSPDVCTGNQTQVLRESNTCPWPLSHLSTPSRLLFKGSADSFLYRFSSQGSQKS